MTQTVTGHTLVKRVLVAKLRAALGDTAQVHTILPTQPKEMITGAGELLVVCVTDRADATGEVKVLGSRPYRIDERIEIDVFVQAMVRVAEIGTVAASQADAIDGCQCRADALVDRAVIALQRIVASDPTLGEQRGLTPGGVSLDLATIVRTVRQQGIPGGGQGDPVAAATAHTVTVQVLSRTWPEVI
jgi:hypothetical protein